MVTNVSLWEEDCFFAPCDFLIVGSGLLGLWTAWELKKCSPQANILVVDRGVIPVGASTRNAGFACFGSPGEILSDCSTMGEDKMWELVKMRFNGVQKIKQHFGTQLIDFVNCGGYECFKDDSVQYEAVVEKLGWLNKGMQFITGQQNTFQWSKQKLQQFGLTSFADLIENKYEGGIHSGKLVQCLLQKVQQSGVRVLFGIQVLDWQKVNGSVEVTTNTATLKANEIIFCTNGIVNDFFNVKKVEPARGQVLVTSAIPALAVKGTFHFDEGYYYFRNVENRVLLGGARNVDKAAEHSDQMVLNDDIQNALEHFLQKHILCGQTYAIDYRWSGVMGFSDNKLPQVTEVAPGVITALCCNGMGVALSPIIAEEICKILVH